MEEIEEPSMDDILKSIREAVLEKEQRAYFDAFLNAEEEVVSLSKNMLVKREDIPYDSGMWTFADVAKKIMKKYDTYFNNRRQKGFYRVRVKEDIAPEKVSS